MIIDLTNEKNNFCTKCFKQPIVWRKIDGQRIVEFKVKCHGSVYHVRYNKKYRCIEKATVVKDTIIKKFKIVKPAEFGLAVKMKVQISV